MWLATDGETLRRNLGPSLSGDIAGEQPPAPIQRETTHLSDGDALLGSLQIVLALRPTLSALANGTVVDIFLSSDQLRIMQNEDVSQLLTEMIADIGLRLRMVVCVSGNTQAMSRLLDAYMPSLVSATCDSPSCMPRTRYDPGDGGAAQGQLAGNRRDQELDRDKRDGTIPGGKELSDTVSFKDCLSRSDGNNKTITMVTAVLEIEVTQSFVCSGGYWYPYELTSPMERLSADGAALSN